MKNILKGILCLILLSCMIGCGASEANKGTPLSIQAMNTIENYAEFSLFKIETVKEMKAPIHTGLYYESKSEAETYVDVVLDWKNLSTQSFQESELVTITAKNENGIEYNDVLYVVETSRGTSLSQFEEIKPLTTARVHCGISVPITETNLTITLKVKNEMYTCEYSLNSKVSNEKELKENDEVVDKDYAAFVFKGIEYTDDLLPPDTSKAYRHYKVDDTNNTYLVVKFDLTNYMSDDLDCDEIFGMKAIYMDKYNYDGFAVIEDEDGRGFSSFEDIKPLTTRSFYYLIEVPKSVQEESLKLNIYFNKQEFYYIK